MSWRLAGALIGLALAIVDLIVLRMLASRVEMDETKKVLNVAGMAQVILFPVIGWFVAPYVIGE